MQVELHTEAQQAIYELRLKYPKWKQRQIADALNVSRELVAKVDRKRKVAYLIQVPESIRKMAYQAMEEAADAYELYITELEELKSKKKEIVLAVDKEIKKTLLLQSPTEISNIIKLQIDTRTKLCDLRTLEEPQKVLDWIEQQKISNTGK